MVWRIINAVEVVEVTGILVIMRFFFGLPRFLVVVIGVVIGIIEVHRDRIMW